MFEADTHSFIVKIWREETNHATWRGHITHVPGGERCYVQDLDDISAFLLPYLERLGMRLTFCWRVRRCLHCWKR